MKAKDIFLATIASILVSLSGACASDSDTKIPADTLVKIGKAVYTKSDLDKNMPGGLNETDSTRFAHALLRTWIDDQLIRQVAARQIDMTEIEKEVQRYRNELIMLEYTQKMFEDYGGEEISEDSLRSYYDNHQEEFRLSRPMVKGLYLKVADDAKTLPSLRKLYRSKSQEDIDKLEKSELVDAVHYDFFRDKWIDWEQIESRIPYDFGASPDAFLKANDHIDASYGGFTYLLDINDMLPTGSITPYEVARQQIIDRLTFYQSRDFKKKLKKHIYDDAISNGKITLFCELGEN